MDYEKLKEVIAKKIKENGREEITGPVLQMVLMAMVDSLGEVYPHTYTEEQKAQARANIDALSDHNGEITKEKLSADVQAILNDVANKQNITDESLATIAKTIVGAINEVYKGGLEDASIATSKIEDGAITEPKLDADLVNIITSAVQPAELASALASYVAKEDILDTTGSATDKVMSQHGVTEAINGVTIKVADLDKEVYGKKDEDYKSGIKGCVTITSEIGSRAVINIVPDDIWFYNNIPILKGAHIVIKTQGGSRYRAYYLLGNNDILLETADPSLTGYRTYIIDAEEAGKIITNCNPIGGSYSLTISYPQGLKDIVDSHNQKIEVLETDTSMLKESQESIENIVFGSALKDYTSELKVGYYKGYAIGSVHDCKVLPDTSENPWMCLDIQTNEGEEFEFALRGGPTYPAVSILDENNVVIDIEVMSLYTIIKKIMPTGAKRILINDDPSKGTASIIKLARKGLEEQIEILNDKIEKIEEDSIVNHNKDIAHIIQSSSAFIGNQQEGTSGIKTQHKYLTILHGSDFHNDGVRFGRLVDMLNYYNIFDCAVLTGDFCKDSYADYGFEKTFVAHYKRSKKPLIYSIGNHDVGVEKNIVSIGGKINSIENCDDRFINPYASYFNLTKGPGGYCYNDFNTYKVRLISINEYEMPRVTDTDTKYKYDLWYRYLSQTQVNWLINSLNVEAGWSVIIAMHQLPNALTVYDNKFKSSYNATSGDYKDSQGNLLVELIDAYISKVALNKTYVNTIGAPSSDVPDVTVNVDFSNYNGTFICYLNGHTHGDMIGEVTSAVNKQLNLNITSGGCIYKSYYDDIMRVDGTKSQDCFNMVVFDTDKHKVRLLRIGANTTLNMTYRDMESISYVE